MPAKLPPEVQQAMDAPPTIPTHRDLQEMINQERAKDEAAKPQQPKEESKPAAKEEKSVKDDAAKATEILAKRLGFDRPAKEKTDEKKETKPEGKTAERGDGKDKDGSDKTSGADTADGAKDGLEKGVGDGKPAEETPKKGKVSKKKEIDPVEIATHAATRAAQEVLQSTDTRAREEQRTPVQKPIDETLSDEERQELVIFQEMAQSNAAFKSLPNQYLAYLKKAESYQRNWEKDHPGEEFDPEADEHDKFFKNAEPKYSQRDFAKAEARLEARELIAKERETFNKETSTLRADLAVRELEPNIRNTQIGATAEIIKTVNEDWLKTIEKDGFQKFSESNPLEADLINAVAKNIGPFIAAALAIDDPKGRVPFNQTDPSHREWGDYLTAKENALRTLPMKDRQTEDGRIIVSRQEYASLPPTKRAAYAYYDSEQLINMRVAEEAERVQEFYEREQKRIEAIAKARGWTKATEQSNQQNDKNGEPPKPEKPEQKREEVKSPEAASSARVDTSNTAPAIGSNEFSERLSAVLFRRP